MATKEEILALRRGALLEARDNIASKRALIKDLCGETPEFRGMGYAVNLLNNMLNEDEALLSQALVAL
jgi:hypothetical protein